MVTQKQTTTKPQPIFSQRVVKIVGLLLVSLSLTLNVILWNSNADTPSPVQLSLYDVVSALPMPSVPRPTVDIGVGGSDISKTSLNVTKDDWRKAYEIATTRFTDRSSQDQDVLTAPNLRELLGFGEGRGKAQPRAKRPIMHLIRIPKGGSSYLSITARALTGCNPDGYPCCIKKHDKEYCPKEHLYCGWIHGCVGHFSLKEPSNPIPKITALRDPAGRLLSGFFYPEGSHNRKHKGCTSWGCFTEYLEDERVRDTVTKMIVGRKVYEGRKIMPGEVHVAKERLCGLSWFGMVDMPLASKLLLYEMEPFEWIKPSPVVFDLPPEGGGGVFEEQHVRINANSTYRDFVEGDFVRKGGRELVARLNSYEYELYAFAWGLFCARIRESGLLEYRDDFSSRHHFDECLKPKYETAAVKDYCPSLMQRLLPSR